MPAYKTQKKLAAAIRSIDNADIAHNNKEALKTFVLESKSTDLKPITIERYLRVLKKIGEYITWSLINPTQQQLKELVADINMYVFWEQDSISPWTRKKYKSALSKFYELVNTDPDLSWMSINVKRSEQKDLTPHKYPDRDDASQIVSEAMNHRDGALLSMLWDTGARISELLHVKWKHVDLEEPCVTIVRGKTGSRTIPIKEAAERITWWKKSCGWKTGHVFGNLDSNDGSCCITNKRSNDIIRECAQRTQHGADLLTTKYWRKGRACYLASLGYMNAFQLAQWMGWSDIDTARYYIQIMNANLQETVARSMAESNLRAL